MNGECYILTTCHRFRVGSVGGVRDILPRILMQIGCRRQESLQTDTDSLWAYAYMVLTTDTEGDRRMAEYMDSNGERIEAVRVATENEEELIQLALKGHAVVAMLLDTGFVFGFSTPVTAVEDLCCMEYGGYLVLDRFEVLSGCSAREFERYSPKYSMDSHDLCGHFKSKLDDTRVVASVVRTECYSYIRRNVLLYNKYSVIMVGLGKGLEGWVTHADHINPEKGYVLCVHDGTSIMTFLPETVVGVREDDGALMSWDLKYFLDHYELDLSGTPQDGNTEEVLGF